VFTLAVNDRRWNSIGKHFAFLGNISYSSYLLHFPLQLVFLLAVLFTGGSVTVFRSIWVFLVYFAILIPLSLASYYQFERPMQDFLRRKLVNTRT